MQLCTTIPFIYCYCPAPVKAQSAFSHIMKTQRINCVLFDYVYPYPDVTLPTRPWSQWSLQWCPMTTWRARPDWAASTALHAQPRSTRGPGLTGSIDPLMHSVFGHLHTLTELNCRQPNQFSPQINGMNSLMWDEQCSTCRPFVYSPHIVFHILNSDAGQRHGFCSASINKAALRVRSALDHHSFITELCAGAQIHPSILSMYLLICNKNSVIVLVC